MVRLRRMTRCRGMRKLSIFILVILASTLVPSSSRAQNISASELREQAADKEAKQEDLVNLGKDKARAMQADSVLLFRRIYGVDFVGVFPSGQILDKAGW